MEIRAEGDRKIMHFYAPAHSAPNYSVIEPGIWEQRIERRLNPRLPRWQTFLAPRPRKDMVTHAFARVPVTRQPFLIFLEQHLPRPYGVETPNPVWKFARSRLLRANCLKIIAMSEYAKRFFLSTHEVLPGAETLAAKTEVVYPGIERRAHKPKSFDGGPLKLLFVGHMFAQKGGIAALRVKKLADQIGLPLELTVVSDLAIGPSIAVDHVDKSRYDRDLEVFNLPGVKRFGHIPNEHVLQLMEEHHFTLLPSLDDTFGFSMVESQTCATPVISSNINALPEIVTDGENGLVVELEKNRLGSWVQREKYYSSYGESFTPEFTKLRSGDEYWGLLDDAYQSMAEQMLDRLSQLVDEPERYAQLSANALARVRTNHDIHKVAARLAELGEKTPDKAVDGRLATS